MKKLTHILIVLVLLLSLGSNAVFSTNNRTQPFTDEYHFLRSWGGEGLFAPKGIDFTSDGTVLVVDESANRLTLLNPYLQVSNNWGDFGQEPSQFDQPLDTAIDHLGNIYVSDSGNDRIQKFSPTGEFILEWGSHGSYPGQFYFPAGIAVGPGDEIYVADIWNDRIQKFTSTGQFILQWGSQGTAQGQFQNPEAIAIDTDGFVYVADTWNFRVQKFSSDGAYITEWRISDPGYSNLAIGLAVQGNQYVYVIDGYEIKKFTTTGNLLLRWGGYGTEQGQFVSPRGIGVDTNQNVFVVDRGTIQKFSELGAFITQYYKPTYEPGYFAYPGGSATDQDGNIYVADTNYHRIQKFSSSGTFILTWGVQGSGSSQFLFPNDLAIDQDGMVFVADSGNHRVQVFNSEGVYVRSWGTNGNGPGQFNYPKGITVAGNYVYVADTENYRIQVFDKNGNFERSWLCQDPVFERNNPPQDIALDSVGNVYTLFLDYVQKSTSEGAPLNYWGSYGSDIGQLNTARSIAVNSNNEILISDSFNHRIQIFDSNGTYQYLMGSRGNSEGKFSYPGGIALYEDALIVVDTGNARIQTFTKSLPEADPYSGLVQAGDIESDTLLFWTNSGKLPVSISSYAYQGAQSLQLGIAVPQIEQGQGEAKTFQTFYIDPSWARPVLTFKYNLFVNDIMDYSDFFVAIQDGVGLNHLATVVRDGFQPCIPNVAPSPGRDLGWRSIAYDLSAYKGQPIRLVFSNRNLWPDSWGIWTNVDDVRVLDAGLLPPLAGPFSSFLPVINSYRCDSVTLNGLNKGDNLKFREDLTIK